MRISQTPTELAVVGVLGASEWPPPAMQASSWVCRSVMFLRRMSSFPLMSTSDSLANAHTCGVMCAARLKHVKTKLITSGPYQFSEPVEAVAE